MRFKQFVPQILREYSREVTAQKLGTPLLQKFLKEPAQWQVRIVGDTGGNNQVALNALLQSVEQADPTKNKQYVPWIIRNYINNPSLRFEDATSKVTEPLKKFFQLVNKKQIPAPNNDIGRIRDLATLIQVVDQFPDVVDQPKNVNRGQAKPYYEDQDIRVIIPQDEAAACYYGQGTKWCTAGRENNFFSRYNSQGPMYIILPKNPAHPGEKYQFHFQSKQFMNELDQRVNLQELRARFPQLADIFAKQAADHGIMPLDKTMDGIQAQLNEILPIFGQTLRTMISREGRRVARSIANQLGQASKVFRGELFDEVWELAEMMMEEDVVPKVRNIVYMVQDQGIDVVEDEDQLYDVISELAGQIRNDSDLWIYVTEILEDLEDEEGEFDCAMAIDGEVSSIVIDLIPLAFREAANSFNRSAPTQ